MPLIGLRGEGGMVYMAMVNTRDSTQGMVKIWETAIRHSKQLARHSWDVVNPGLDKPEKEAVVPKVAETSKEDGAGCSCRPAGPQIHADKANGVFHPTEVAHRVFPPPTIGFFFLLTTS